MSNIESAAKVIDQWTKEGHELNSVVGSPHVLAERLADAGLITPDLPEPTAPGEWELADGITVTADQDEIAITAPIKGGHTIICWYGNPTQAQELAHTLLAATQQTREHR